jgi:superfamily I DNA/RNA helicase
MSQLQAADFDIYEIKRNTAEQRDKPGLRVATMHRVKGLEFEHVIAVAANKGILPLESAVDDAEDNLAKRDAETSERSLLFVALTRARRSAAVMGYGAMTSFLAAPLETTPKISGSRGSL